MSAITVKIRSSIGSTFELQIQPDALTVSDLKELLTQHFAGTTATDLRLVYSGRILKDPDMVSTYSKLLWRQHASLPICSLFTSSIDIRDGHVIHVVKSGSSKAQESSSPSSTAQTSTTPTSPSTDTTQQTRSPANPPFPGGLGGLESLGGNMPDPEVMRTMMESPMMQSMMNNPELMRSIMMSNPQIRAMVEQNPEIGHVINDPNFLRQSMQMMRNPELMREMQRNNDRALSNIEAIPGGFNHLRRMYSTLQDPLESAARSTGSDSEEANQRLAERLNVQNIPENQLNTQALPNPWAPSSNSRQTSPATQASSTANPFAALGGGIGDLPSPFFNMSPANSANSGDQNNNYNNNNTTSTTNPPPLWMNPDFLQFSMRMQQMMQQQQQQQPQSGGVTGNNSSTPFPLFNPFGMQQPSTTNTTPSQPPEQRFASQITQLEEMGFSERDRNVRALLATGGDVQAAIEYLLSQ
ncbi:hypothetical protein BGW37DRAFT_535063 [Umbelopsis sp. PMI_123]|nr:hypothetical protein BGW37DRAFT_535063 [Umbelopsis sp. PMI_123]